MSKAKKKRSSFFFQRSKKAKNKKRRSDPISITERQNRRTHQQLNHISFPEFSAEARQTIHKWMIITLIPRVLFLSRRFPPVRGEIMKGTLLGTMSAANKRVPAKSTGAAKLVI